MNRSIQPGHLASPRRVGNPPSAIPPWATPLPHRPISPCTAPPTASAHPESGTARPGSLPLSLSAGATAAIWPCAAPSASGLSPKGLRSPAQRLPHRRGYLGSTRPTSLQPRMGLWLGSIAPSRHAQHCKKAGYSANHVAVGPPSCASRSSCLFSRLATARKRDIPQTGFPSRRPVRACRSSIHPVCRPGRLNTCK
jgi:hypothetical protein